MTQETLNHGNRERLAWGPGGGNEHPWSSHGCGETLGTMPPLLAIPFLSPRCFSETRCCQIKLTQGKAAKPH